MPKESVCQFSNNRAHVPEKNALDVFAGLSATVEPSQQVRLDTRWGSLLLQGKHPVTINLFVYEKRPLFICSFFPYRLHQ